MDDLLSRFFTGGNGGGWPLMQPVPPLELSETDNEVRVRIDVPGMKPDELDIHVAGKTLTIRGERKEEKEEKDRTFHRVERRYGTFSRSVELPCPVNEQNVEARCKDGVLTISMQKTEKARSHKVEVKA